MTLDAPTCDVAVLGGGPAGSAAALLLARAGVKVVQFLGAPDRRPRPFEVLHPRALRLFPSYGAPLVEMSATSCSGVLRLWETAEPDLEDFHFAYAQAGVSINRAALHGALARAAAQAGVIQVGAAAMVSAAHPGGRRDVAWRSGQDGVRTLQAGWVMVATGRRAAGGGRSLRTSLDRLVALAVPWAATERTDVLLIEALEVGWWYASPAPAGRSHFVFLTDSDLLPKDLGQRRSWIDQAVRSSRLLPDFGPAPCFQSFRGVDAHTGRAEDPAGEGLAQLGDAAMSLDPLSGAGVQRALEGAAVVAEEFLHTGCVGPAYRIWLSTLWADQLADRETSHEAAARRFPNSGFWGRRRVTNRPDSSEAHDITS